MQEVLDIYTNIRANCESYNKEVSTQLKIKETEIPAGFFGMTFNNATITLELLHFYFNLWGKMTGDTQEEIDQSKRQNGERVILICKLSFIEVMSMFEFIAKSHVVQTGKLSGFGSRVYLYEIMKKSKESGFITDAQLDLWSGAIFLRNCLVHNNGINDRTQTFNFPNFSLNLVQNSMTQGNLKMFGQLTEWVVEEAKFWILALK